MAHNELDSFILKFKNLWQAGCNAKLSLKSIDGKAEAHFSVELGDAPAIQRSRNGPSRQRRRERRAAAREAAEQANNELIVAEEVSIVTTDGGNLVAINKDTTNDEKQVKTQSYKMNSAVTMIFLIILLKMILLSMKLC